MGELTKERMAKIIYGEPTREVRVYPPEPEEETKRLERHLAEALADLINPIRPTEVGNRINSAFNLLERVQCDLRDVLAIERKAGHVDGYAAGLAEHMGDLADAYQEGKAAGIAEANTAAPDSRPVEYDRNFDEVRGRL